MKLTLTTTSLIALLALTAAAPAFAADGQDHLPSLSPAVEASMRAGCPAGVRERGD